VKEYFDLEYREIPMKVQYNVERVIDDFLLLFFLVGNDFLPRVYCFDIKQGTVELLIDTFKEFLS
jgi:5'-3' exoribonuclease 1